MQIHIVHFDSENQIKQIRIHWDQASLLRQVEVIGTRGRAWPIRDAKDQIRLLKTATTERATTAVPAEQTKLPTRSSSPHKRYTKDPYAAESLTELISPSKEAPKPASNGKRYTQDPYGAGSLDEILSPSKKAPAAVAPFAPSSGRPAARNFSDIFVKDDGAPESPSKPPRRAPQVPEEEEELSRGPVDENRAFYKSAPGKYNHFEIGNFDTPVKPNRAPRGQEVRHFDLTDDESPEKLKVAKPRRDADRHFELTDDEGQQEARIISSFGGRGKNLYANHLFNDSDTPEKKGSQSVTGNTAGRNKNLVSQFDIEDDLKENDKPTANHGKAVKMMESHWDNYDETPQPTRHATATALHNPLKHNQPSWHHGDE